MGGNSQWFVIIYQHLASIKIEKNGMCMYSGGGGDGGNTTYRFLIPFSLHVPMGKCRGVRGVTVYTFYYRFVRRSNAYF